tara:strand:+ start:297 stop:548 length:252 start_codon:yes stop_codon:yes gene_type:complete
MNIFKQSKTLSDGNTYPIPFRHATNVIMQQFPGKILSRGYIESILNPEGDPDINRAINFGVQDVIYTEGLYVNIGNKTYQRVS